MLLNGKIDQLYWAPVQIHCLGINWAVQEQLCCVYKMVFNEHSVWNCVDLQCIVVTKRIKTMESWCTTANQAHQRKQSQQKSREAILQFWCSTRTIQFYETAVTVQFCHSGRTATMTSWVSNDLSVFSPQVSINNVRKCGKIFAELSFWQRSCLQCFTWERNSG